MTPSRMIGGGLSANAVLAISGDIATGISAAGTTQVTATAITADRNYIGTAAASSGVILQSGEVGKTVLVYNGGANSVNIYPPVGGAINTIATNSPMVLAVGKTAYFDYSSALVISGDLYTAPTSEVVTSIATVGAGTLTAAALVGGILTRDGAQSATAFTDTTATAAQIVAAISNAQVGQSVRCTIKNNTDGAMTITAGSGVTLTGQAVIAANSWCEFVIVLTSLTAVAMTGVESGLNLVLPVTNYITQSAANQTAAVGELLGAQRAVLNLSANGANAYTTRTGAQMAADIPNIQVGMTWGQRICATGNNTVTLTAAASGVTITGTATAATGAYRDYVVTYAAANTFVFQNIGGGSI